MNFEQILELIRTVSNSELTAFQYEEGNQKITMQAHGNVMNMVGFDGIRINAETQSYDIPSSIQTREAVPMNMRNADVQSTNMQGTNLQGTNLQGTNLQSTNLQSTNLQGTNLQGTNLQGTNLQSTNMQSTNMQSISTQNVSGSAPIQAVEEPVGNVVTSPLVGRFYVAPAEDAEPFVKVGDTVQKGQVLAIVEAMKLMNEIESDYDGVVAEILADNGEGVEYGQPLFRITVS